MKKYLLKLGQWLVRLYGPPPTPPEIRYIPQPGHIVPTIDQAILDLTKGLISMADSWDSTGEYKRHTVYAKLIKAFPDADKKTLALAIELVISKVV